MTQRSRPSAAAPGDPHRRRPVLVAGLPRSGTTWTAQILAGAPGAVGVMEPDNEKTSAVALGAKRGLGRFPVLAPGDGAEGYRRLWSWALAGSPVGPGLRVGDRLLRSASARQTEQAVSGPLPLRLHAAAAAAGLGIGHSHGHGDGDGDGDGRRVVVKSVHVPLALEWLADAFDVDVLVVLRHPANVLASWLDLGLPDRDRHLDRLPAVHDRYLRRWGVGAAGSDPLERVVWQLGLLTSALEEAAARHPRWIVRVHEEMCVDPPAEFRRLYGELGLEWTPDVEAQLEAGDRPGQGFTLHRRAAEEADAWRSRLGPAEVAALPRVLRSFPLTHWSADEMPGDACAG